MQQLYTRNSNATPNRASPTRHEQQLYASDPSILNSEADSQDPLPQSFNVPKVTSYKERQH